MSRYANRPAPQHQPPPERVVVSMEDLLKKGWWPNVARTCPDCGGRMGIDPPSYEPGRIYCLFCSRETADVVAKIRPPEVLEPEHPRCPRCGRSAQPMHTAVCRSCYMREFRARKREVAS